MAIAVARQHTACSVGRQVTLQFLRERSSVDLLARLAYENFQSPSADAVMTGDGPWTNGAELEAAGKELLDAASRYLDVSIDIAKAASNAFSVAGDRLDQLAETGSAADAERFAEFAAGIRDDAPESTPLGKWVQYTAGELPAVWQTAEQAAADVVELARGEDIDAKAADAAVRNSGRRLAAGFVTLPGTEIENYAGLMSRGEIVGALSAAVVQLGQGNEL
jgi:hypothetical protein